MQFLTAVEELDIVVEGKKITTAQQIFEDFVSTEVGRSVTNWLAFSDTYCSQYWKFGDELITCSSTQLPCFMNECPVLPQMVRAYPIGINLLDSTATVSVVCSASTARCMTILCYKGNQADL